MRSNHLVLGLMLLGVVLLVAISVPILRIFWRACRRRPVTGVVAVVLIVAAIVLTAIVSRLEFHPHYVWFNHEDDKVEIQLGIDGYLSHFQRAVSRPQVRDAVRQAGAKAVPEAPDWPQLMPILSFHSPGLDGDPVFLQYTYPRLETAHYTLIPWRRVVGPSSVARRREHLRQANDRLAAAVRSEVVKILPALDELAERLKREKAEIDRIRTLIARRMHWKMHDVSDRYHWRDFRFAPRNRRILAHARLLEFLPRVLELVEGGGLDGKAVEEVHLGDYWYDAQETPLWIIDTGEIADLSKHAARLDSRPVWERWKKEQRRARLELEEATGIRVEISRNSAKPMARVTANTLRRLRRILSASEIKELNVTDVYLSEENRISEFSGHPYLRVAITLDARASEEMLREFFRQQAMAIGPASDDTQDHRTIHGYTAHAESVLDLRVEDGYELRKESRELARRLARAADRLSPDDCRHLRWIRFDGSKLELIGLWEHRTLEFSQTDPEGDVGRGSRQGRLRRPAGHGTRESDKTSEDLP